MNSSMQNKLSEVVGANNIAYVLNQNSSFSMTGYKVMQNHNGSGLLKCAKLSYNGKIKLVYIVENLKPLSHVATRLGVNELNAVIFNLIQRALEIKSNGFFRAENLELDFDKIFVDTADDSVYLIYFPISGGTTGKISGFENEFRIALINLFNSFPVFNAPQFQRLCSDLSNGSLPLEQILKKLQDNINGNNFNQRNYEPGNMQQEYSQKAAPGPSVSGQNCQAADLGYQRGVQQQPVFGFNNGYQPHGYNTVVKQNRQPAMTITAINSPVQVSFVINTPEYLLGKNPDMVHGAIMHNPAISRVHCKISYSGGRYFVTDMASANGTFVNQQHLEKHQTVEINSGDCLKLANSDFIVSF